MNQIIVGLRLALVLGVVAVAIVIVETMLLAYAFSLIVR